MLTLDEAHDLDVAINAIRMEISKLASPAISSRPTTYSQRKSAEATLAIIFALTDRLRHDLRVHEIMQTAHVTDEGQARYNADNGIVKPE